MAPFPVRRHARNPSNSLLPTIHSSLSPSSSPSPHAYPPLPPSNPTSPSISPRASFSSFPPSPQPNASFPAAPHPLDPRFNAHSQQKDPRVLFGMVEQPTGGLVGGLGGITAESRDTVRRCLEENHVHAHTFFNDKGFHNHCAHHLLAAYSMGATPQLLEEILSLHHETAFKPMPDMVPMEITEANWTEHLGDERFYPNYLRFFHRLIATPPPPTSPYFAKGHRTSTVPVLEQYLFGGRGEMLLRCVSGAIHPLIHIGHGVEFKLDALVAEGLAQCAVHKAQTGNLFPSAEFTGATWPPQPPKPSGFQSTLSSAFSSLRIGNPFGSSSSASYSTSSSAATAAASYLAPSSHFPIASGSDSFARTAAALPRGDDDHRYPREGLSGFTILDRILHDDALAPGRACGIDAMPKLDAVLDNPEAAARLRAWCDEWKFSTQASGGWEDAAGRDSDEGSDGEGARERERRRQERARKGKMKGYGTPGWQEIVEKYEELVWMATVLHAAGTRPGYKKVKLDFFIMHGLTSVLFLPPLLEVISPHLRPYLLTSHFRVLVAYWVSRGRPPLYIKDTLLAAPSAPTPPLSTPAQPYPAGTAVGRALQDARRKQQRREARSGRSSRATSPSPSPSGAQDVHHDGFVESPLTPRAAADQLPFSEGRADGGLEDVEWRLDEGSNPWMVVLKSAVDHDDEHVTKTVRSLYFAAAHFGASPKGMFQSSLPGVNEMDGSIFIRAAGLTLASVGWRHEGDAGNMGTWDRSGLGWPSTWEKDELLPGREFPPPSFAGKGKGRASPPLSNSISPSNSPYLASAPSLSSSQRSVSRTRSGTITLGSPVPPHSGGSGFSTAAHPGQDEEVVQFSPNDSALLSPRLAAISPQSSRSSSPAPGAGAGSYRPYYEDSSRAASPSPSPVEARPGWRKVGEQFSEEEERAKAERAKREEEERELMA
ncbi:hypothetical protein JCM10207_008073 [Rhodosporidiobolus poonsookiae]